MKVLNLKHTWGNVITKTLLFVTVALATVSFSSCSNEEANSTPKSYGLKISDYQIKTKEYLATTKATKTAAPWQNIVAADGAGALTGGLVGGLIGNWAGCAIGGVVGGGLCSLESWVPGTMNTVVDVATKVVDVVKTIWGKIFGAPPAPHNGSDINDYDEVAQNHYKIVTEVLETHPDLEYDILEVYNQECSKYDPNFKPLTESDREELENKIKYPSSDDFFANYNENLRKLFLDGISDEDINKNSEFIFEVVDLYNSAFQSTSDVQEFYEYSLSIEDMLHEYYLNNGHSALAHKALIWMSIHRRGSEYWSYVNSQIK